MGRANIPFLSFNRGLLSPKALARVDLDRTRLSAEVFTNWIPSTQGSMSIRPGTRYLGSSLHDTGAEWIEFVASTDDVALLELTHGKMRVWLGEDAHALELLARPKVDTTVSLSDTGWVNASTGGAFATSAVNAIPTMTGNTTNGVTVSAKSFQILDDFIDTGGQPYHAADNAQGKSRWQDTGTGHSNLPSWWKVNFGSGNAQAIASYSIRAPNFPAPLSMTPKSWELIRSNFDTGTFATDTGKWGLEDARSSQTGWAVNERRSYELPGADTGTIEAYRYWRLTFKAVNNVTDSGAVSVNEIEMFATSTAQQVKLQGGKRVLNAGAIGSMARAEKRLIEVA